MTSPPTQFSVPQSKYEFEHTTERIIEELNNLLQIHLFRTNQHVFFTIHSRLLNLDRVYNNIVNILNTSGYGIPSRRLKKPFAHD